MIKGRRSFRNLLSGTLDDFDEKLRDGLPHEAVQLATERHW